MTNEQATPQTPAEQQELLADALDRLDEGADGKEVLREVFAAMNRAAPAVWERIMACRSCNGKVQIGTEAFSDYTGQVCERPVLCQACHADRLEYAALIGM